MLFFNPPFIGDTHAVYYFFTRGKFSCGGGKITPKIILKFLIQKVYTKNSTYDFLLTEKKIKDLFKKLDMPIPYIDLSLISFVAMYSPCSFISE